MYCSLGSTVTPSAGSARLGHAGERPGLPPGLRRGRPRRGFTCTLRWLHDEPVWPRWAGAPPVVALTTCRDGQSIPGGTNNCRGQCGHHASPRESVGQENGWSANAARLRCSAAAPALGSTLRTLALRARAFATCAHAWRDAAWIPLLHLCFALQSIEQVWIRSLVAQSVRCGTLGRKILQSIVALVLCGTFAKTIRIRSLDTLCYAICPVDPTRVPPPFHRSYFLDSS